MSVSRGIGHETLPMPHFFFNPWSVRIRTVEYTVALALRLVDALPTSCYLHEARDLILLFVEHS